MNIYLNLPAQCECSSGVEHHLAKVRVVGPNPITRSEIYQLPSPGGGIGRHVGLKIQWTLCPYGFKSRPGYSNRRILFYGFFILAQTKNNQSNNIKFINQTLH